jgi:hypothetical protein
MKKEVRQLLRELERQGWTWQQRKSGHIRCFDPKTGNVFFMAHTPAPGKRGLDNSRAQLRKLGADV